MCNSIEMKKKSYMPMQIISPFKAKTIHLSTLIALNFYSHIFYRSFRIYSHNLHETKNKLIIFASIGEK